MADATHPNFVGDSDILAIIPNSEEIRCFYGELHGVETPDESNVPIGKIIVWDDKGKKEFETGPGKDKSGWFLWYLWKISGIEDHRVEISAQMLKEDDVFYGIFGKKVCDDAQNEELTNHGFVRAVFGGDGKVTIEFITKPNAIV